MRVMKLALGALAALIVARGSAYAIDVNKHIDAPGQVLVVWAIASDFCDARCSGSGRFGSGATC